MHGLQFHDQTGKVLLHAWCSCFDHDGKFDSAGDGAISGQISCLMSLISPASSGGGIQFNYFTLAVPNSVYTKNAEYRYNLRHVLVQTL